MSQDRAIYIPCASDEPVQATEFSPEYDHTIETVLHCRCTVCSGWWHLENAPADRSYWCPHCGKQLASAQYPEDKAAPRPNHTTGIIDL